MFKSNKGISVPIIIIIVVIVAVVAGGIVVWQGSQAPGAPSSTPSPAVSPTPTPTPVVSPTPTPKTTPTPDITANWKTYRNDEYGFEVKYPFKIKEEQIHEWKNPFTIGFSYYCPNEITQVAYHSLQVSVNINSSQLSIRDWVYQYEYCGNKNQWNLERFTLENIEGIRIRNVGTCPPGAGKLEDKVYLSKDSKIYTIQALRELGTSEGCVAELENTFNQFLSTFRFLE